MASQMRTAFHHLIKKMKKTLLFLLFFFFFTVKAENAEVKVEYTYIVRGNPDRRILKAGIHHSKYYDPQSEWYDSIRSTSEGMAHWKQMFQAEGEYIRSQGGIAQLESSVTYPGRGLYVIKNDSSMTLYDKVNIDKYFYEEPRGTIKWEIKDDSKAFLGYECIKATGKYHGRKWEVWFTPDIPISDGPWKLCGLPGLILYAKDKSGEFVFEAQGIEKDNEHIPSVYGKDKYEKIKRKELLRAQRRHSDNPLGSYVASSGSVVSLPAGINFGRSETVNGKPKNDFIETDY